MLWQDDWTPVTCDSSFTGKKGAGGEVRDYA